MILRFFEIIFAVFLGEIRSYQLLKLVIFFLPHNFLRLSYINIIILNTHSNVWSLPYSNIYLYYLLVLMLT
jgi:hypothetical protein